MQMAPAKEKMVTQQSPSCAGLMKMVAWQQTICAGGKRECGAAIKGSRCPMDRTWRSNDVSFQPEQNNLEN